MKTPNQSVKENSLFNDSLTEQKIEQDSFVSYSEYIDFDEMLSKNCFIDTCDSESLNTISKILNIKLEEDVESKLNYFDAAFDDGEVRRFYE